MNAPEKGSTVMGISTTPVNSPGGHNRHSADQERLRHAREKSSGFPIGQYRQPPPMLFTRDGHNVFLGDMYRGCAAFLVCSGPSLHTHDLKQLNNRGILTMAVNNAATIVRPNLWCSVDDPGNFSDAIWYDPAITKFIPLCHMEKKFTVRDARGDLVESSDRVGDMPSVFGFRRNESFVAEQFLTEDTFNWGNHATLVDSSGNKGSRSVMYIAIRMLYYMGVRSIYLIGCDFQMRTGSQNYAFPQDRTDSSVKGNNSSYKIMNNRFELLLPYFEKAGLKIFNCTPQSGLKVFPQMSYDEAIEYATSSVPRTINTNGMYDRKSRQGKSQRSPDHHSPHDVLSQPHCDSPIRDPSELSVVVPVLPESVSCLRESLATWITLKPWMNHFLFQVLCHQDVDKDLVGEVLESKVKSFQIRTIEMGDEIENSWERAKIVTIPHMVGTDWYWMLDPSAIATSRQDWFTSSRFSGEENNRVPVFTACSWGYTKPANVYQELDDWADDVSLFRDYPRLNWKVDRGVDRIRHPAISTWSFLANTQWTRDMASVVDHETPITEHSAFMLFCAERRNEPFNRFPFKQYGWDHSFGWNAGQVKRRGKEILASQGLQVDR